MTKFLDVLTISCSGEAHRLGITARGQIALLDHPDYVNERRLQKLGGPEAYCYWVVRNWINITLEYGIMKQLATEARLRQQKRRKNDHLNRDPLRIKTRDRFNFMKMLRENTQVARILEQARRDQMSGDFKIWQAW